MRVTHEQGMQLALAAAREAGAAGEVPVGAALVRGDEVLAVCGNRRERDHDPTAHAEVLALREGGRRLGGWRLRDCTLYVTLEPCPMCAGALGQSQLGLCVYGASDPAKGCCGSVYDLPADPALHGETRWVSGVRREECEALLRAFFRDKRGE